MSLSVFARLKAFVRVVRVLVSPKTQYLNLLWSIENPNNKVKDDILTHTFYQEGDDPTDPFLVYMARVAGRSKNLEDMNKRAEFYLDKVAVAYMLFNPSEEHAIAYIAKPLRQVPKKTEVENDEDESES